MTLLYLTEDYLYSKVHNNLLANLLAKDETLKIYVFSPLRKGDPVPETMVNSFRQNERLIVVTPMIDIPIWLYRYDFWAKLRYKIKMIEKSIPMKLIDAIHAATLYAEGGVALRLHKKYHIPYFVSIRGTDAILYTHKMPHLWCMGNRIMKNANVLSCVTPTIKDKMLSQWQYYPCRKDIRKAEIVTNGVDDVWINNIFREVKPLGNPIRILYIGRFDSNKNVLRLIFAIKKLREKYDVRLTMIGGGGEQHDAVVKLVEDNSKYLDYLGRIYDKNKLIEITRQCDMFAMVSHSETFGLVYIECLTQGLPILYSKGTGIDGMYQDGVVGYGVDSMSVDSIMEGLNRIIETYPYIRENILKLDFGRYQWGKLAKSYLKYYEQKKDRNGTS